VNKVKSIIPAAAIAFAVLFFGAPASKASGQVAFQAQFATPIGSFGVAAGPGAYYAGHGYYKGGYHGHGYGRPYHGSYRHGYRPYWMKRVYVYGPYPRWSYQRVFYPYPYSYSAPYAYCR